eukprot:610771_1
MKMAYLLFITYFIFISMSSAKKPKWRIQAKSDLDRMEFETEVSRHGICDLYFSQWMMDVICISMDVICISMDVICISPKDTVPKDITTTTIEIDHMIKMILYFTVKIDTHMSLQSNKPNA